MKVIQKKREKVVKRAILGLNSKHAVSSFACRLERKIGMKKEKMTK